MTGDIGTRGCPRCGGTMKIGQGSGLLDASTALQGVCANCGLRLDREAVAELDYLADLEKWAAAKRRWILENGTTGVPMTGAVAGGPAVVVAERPQANAPTAAGCLLAAGVFALFAAGVAFTAFAWSFLGAFGQLMVLLLAGVAAMAGGYRLARRVPGTANALAIAGVLLLVVAAGFWLGADSVATGGVRGLTVAAAAAFGVGSAYRQARRQPGAAVVTATFFAVLSLVGAGAAPALGTNGRSADAPEWMGWWVAGTFLVWGLILLTLDVVQDRFVWSRAPWSWLGTAGLVIATITAAVTAADRLDAARRFGPAPAAVPALVLLVGAMVLLVLDRVSRARWWAVPIGSMVLLAGGCLLLLTALSDPSSRPWMGMLALLATVALVAAAAHMHQRSTFSGRESEHPAIAEVWAGVLIRLAAVAGGGAVALLLAPWTDAPVIEFSGFGEAPASPDATAWLDLSYPWWRGVLIGVAACVVALVVVAIVRGERRRLLPDLPAVAGLATILLSSWVLATDVGGVNANSDVVLACVTASLVVGGLGLLGVLAFSRAPLWTLWAAAGVAAVGGQVAWMWLNLGDAAYSPEVHGLFLAIPLLLAGMICLLLRPEGHVSTWVSVAPALVASLLFPVAAVVDDTASRGTDGSYSTTEALVRIVGLLVVGAFLIVAGARNRWAAPFWVGLGVVVIVAGSQLVDAATALPQWVSLATVGVLLLLAGARWESVRLGGRRTRQWAGTLH